MEVCTCKVLCPCWIEEDPDFGTCDGTFGWHIEKGEIEGVDVSGLTFGLLALQQFIVTASEAVANAGPHVVNEHIRRRQQPV